LLKQLYDPIAAHRPWPRTFEAKDLAQGHSLLHEPTIKLFAGSTIMYEVIQKPVMDDGTTI